MYEVSGTYTFLPIDKLESHCAYVIMHLNHESLMAVDPLYSYRQSALIYS